MPTAHLQTIDWIVIGSYFLVLVAIGLYYRRFANRSMEDYFLSGRRNSGWANGVSYAAALMNADVAPAYSGLTAVTGLFICWWYLTRFGLALFIGAMLFAVFWRRLNLFTVPEFYELRFGGLASNIMRTWVAVRSSLVAMVAWTGTGLLAMYKIAGPVLGLSKNQTMMIVIPIVLIYVGAAGFSGVVATAGLQSLIMFIGSAMLCGIVLYDVGGPVVLAQQVRQLAGGEILHALPPPEHGVFPLAAAIVYLVGSSVGYGGDAAPLGGAMEGQYLLSSKNAKEASKMYLVAEITLFVLLLLVTLPALGAVIDWPGLRSGAIDREMAYGLLMARYLPAGMLGLLFVVMLAAVMSTIGSNLNFGAQVLVNDVYRRYLRPSETDGHYIWVGRLATVLILGLALLVAYNIDLIFQVAIFMLAFSAAELPANWAQWWWWRFNRWGRLSASFGAPLLLVAVKALLPNWPWWDQTYLVIALNTLLWVLVTLVTPPDSPAVLGRFYDRSRPLGAWGPLRRTHDVSDQHRQSRSGLELILSGMLLAALGAASIALFVLAVSHLYVASYARGLLEIMGFGISGALFFAAYGTHLERLEAWVRRQERDLPQKAVSAGSSACPAIVEREVSYSRADQGLSTHVVPLEATAPVQPAPTSVVVAVSTAAYGLLLATVGVLGTRGIDLALNLVASTAFVVSALIVWWLGRGAGASVEASPANARNESAACPSS